MDNDPHPEWVVYPGGSAGALLCIQALKDEGVLQVVCGNSPPLNRLQNIENKQPKNLFPPQNIERNRFIRKIFQTKGLSKNSASSIS